MAFMPRSRDWERRVRDSFGRQPFMATLGARLERVQPGEVAVVVDHHVGLTQQHAFLHAGVTGALADTACGYAAFSLAADDQTVLTVEYKLNLTAPAVGDRYRAVARVIAAGRRIKTVVTSVYADGESEDPRLIGHAQATILTPAGRDDAIADPSGS